MPSHAPLAKPFFDLTNLLLIGAALVITFLPFCIALMVNHMDESPPAHVVNTPLPATAELGLLSARTR